MSTKALCGSFNSRRNYYYPEYEDCHGDEMITDRQRRKLVDYIMSQYNDSDDEKEEKIEALNELTQDEADDYLAEVSRWQ